MWVPVSYFSESLFKRHNAKVHAFFAIVLQKNGLLEALCREVFSEHVVGNLYNSRLMQMVVGIDTAEHRAFLFSFFFHKERQKKTLTTRG